MGLRRVITHVGSYTGNAFTFNACYVTSSYSNTTQYTINECETLIPDIFSRDYTWFAKDSNVANNMVAFGIPLENIIKCWEYTSETPLLLYISSSNYIKVDGSNIRLYEGENYTLSMGLGTRPLAVAYVGNESGVTYYRTEIISFSADRTKARIGTSSSVGSYTFWLDAEFAADDPYSEGGNSGVGGGSGDFDGTGDLISIPSLPTLSASDTGFITLYNPSIAQLKALAQYMWSNPLFDLDAWKKIFADPMQAILGLSIVPVNVPSGSTQAITIGNISTGIVMSVASSQYVEVDCGSLNVNEFWGAYLDYDPYTQCEIYLPYCGIHPLAVDDIMGKSVHVVYHIDILSGAATAFVSCGGTVLYSFVGQCASSIPITGDNWTNVINGAINIAASIGSMIASDGMTAPMAAASIASTAVNQMKPRVEKSGSMGGTGGMLAVQTPYLILTRPQQCLPNKQNTYTGYPSFIAENLSELTGYTEIELIHLENIPATSAEISELETILKGGVIF